MIVGAAALLLIGLISICRYFGKKIGYWKERGIRGPPPRYYYGNSDDLHTLHSPAAYKIRQWTEEYGSVYGFYEGTNRVLVLSDLEAIHDFNSRQFDCFAGKKLLYLVSDEDGEDERVHMAEAIGARWRRLRSSVVPLFTTSSLKKILPFLNDSSVHLVQSIEERGRGKDINVHEFMQEYTFDVICRLVLGQKEAKLFTNPLCKHLKGIFIRDLNVWYLELNLAFPVLSPYLRRLFNTLSARFENPIGIVLKEMENVVDNRIEQKRTSNNNEEGGATDFIDQFLNLKAEEITDASGKSSLTRDEIIAQCFLFIMAGFDTTASTMAFVTHFLALHPDVQTKAREEVEEHCGKEITWEDLQNLTYMDAMIKETLRFYPCGAATTGRKCTKDTVLAGIKVEKGTYVQPDVLTVHADPALWGHDAHRFNPERWFEDAPNRAWLSFGIGPRMCIGVKLAMVEMKIALALMLRNFTIHKGEAFKEHPPLRGSTTFSPVEIPVRLEPRRSIHP